MAPLIDLTTAKTHLRITDSAHDSDVTLKAAEASDAIVSFVTSTGRGKTPPDWTPETVPPRIQSAILYLLAHLYEHRGDDMQTPTNAQVDAALWDSITRMLARDRDPALA